MAPLGTRATIAQRPRELDEDNGNDVSSSQQQPQHRQRSRPWRRRKWPRPCSPQATPRAPIQRPSRVGRRDLVPLLIVQFVINCLLALILSSHNSLSQSSLLLSEASPIESLVVANDMTAHDDERNQMARGGVKSDGERFTGQQVRYREDNDDQEHGPKSRSQSVHKTMSEPIVEGDADRRDDAGGDRSSDPSRRANLILDVLRRRPRWRLNPSVPTFSATSSLAARERGTQQAATLTRRNRFLTIEDETDPMEREEAEFGSVDLFSGKLAKHSDREQRSTAADALGMETIARNRRHPQQQQASSALAATTSASLSDRQRQHAKTRLDIAGAQQAYRNKLIELKQRYLTNRAITDRAYYILLIIYATLITFGTISNSLICLTVIFKPKILSPRNLFIVNLAGSDLLLCIFTMPLTFIELSMKIWQMGLIPCKLVAGLQATSIFVSTISITAIALDRYKVIVYPTHQETASGTRGALLLLASVWIGALSLSLPFFIYRTVEHHEITSPHNQSDPFQLRSPESILDPVQSVSSQASLTSPLDYNNNNNNNNNLDQTKQTPSQAPAFKRNPMQLVDSFDFCIESWPFSHGRGIFSVISMVLQYVLPITIVSFVYTKISRKLQKRLIRRQRLTQLECQQKRQLNLIKRTHTMLVSVSLVFGFSWLPLNLWNMASDFSAEFRHLFDDQTFRIIFAVCHLIGCSSACSNPILYGFLNENFRKEFHQIWNHQARCAMRRLRRLLVCLNCCWLTRKLFACCSCTSQMNLRDEEEEEEEDEDGERDLETSRLAADKTQAENRRHANKQLPITPTSSAIEHGKRHHNATGSLSSGTSNSSNYYTDDDDDQSSSFLPDYTSSARYSDVDQDDASSGSSSSLAEQCKLRPAGQRHLASVNVIPLSLLSLNIDGNLRAANHLRAINYADPMQGQDYEKQRIERGPQSGTRPRADSTPCQSRKRTLLAPGGATRHNSSTLARTESTRSSLLKATDKHVATTNTKTVGAKSCTKSRQHRNQVVQVVMSDEGERVVGAGDVASTTRMVDLEEKRRRFSYSTIISSSRGDGGQQTLGGRAMRLCLCISSSSSAETIGGGGGGGNQRTLLQPPGGSDKHTTDTPNGLEQSITTTNVGGGPANEQEAGRDWRIGSGRDSPAGRRRRRNGNLMKGLKPSECDDGDNLKTAATTIEENRRERRRRARRRQQQTGQRLPPPVQLECECQCHRGSKAAGGAASAGADVSGVAEAAARVQPAEYDTRSLCERPPPPYQPTTTVVDEGEHNESGPQCRTTSAGRRVWLRFLGAGHESTPSATMMSERGIKSELCHSRCLAPNSNARRQVPKEHTSQPDLMRLAEHKGASGPVAAASVSALSLAVCFEANNNNNNNRSLEPPNERIQSSGAFDDTSSQQAHCNNCKHSSVPSARLTPALAVTKQRQQRRRRRASLSRSRRHRQGASTRPNIASDSSASRLPNETTEMKTMSGGEPVDHYGVSTATVAPPGGHKRSRPLSSISSWMSGLRRRKSSGNKEAGQQQQQQQSSSCSVGGASTLARGSSGQLSRQRSGGGSSNSGSRQRLTAASGAKTKSSSSATSVALNSQNQSPNLMTGGQAAASGVGAAQMRNNLHQQQQLQATGSNSPLGTSARVAVLDPSAAPGARQVGTVYLSIETAERDRADSVFSFDGAREKSTSVVVMLAEDDDDDDDGGGEEEARNEAERGREDREMSQPIQSLGRDDAEQLDESVRPNALKALTANTSRGDGLDSNEQHQTSADIDGDRCQELVCNWDKDQRDSGATTEAPVPSAGQRSEMCNITQALARCDANQINDASDQSGGKDSSESKLATGKLAGAICTPALCPDRERTILAADTRERAITTLPDAKFIDCRPNERQKSPPQPLAREHHDACQSNTNRRPISLSQAANECELPTPLTINSSGSSGSVSPSALSFTSACLLQHSSSISSCSCSLTASSFSSGQLNATTTTATSTTQESSLSTSCQTTGAACQWATASAGNSMQHYRNNQQHHHLKVTPSGVPMLLHQQQNSTDSMSTPTDTNALKFGAKEQQQQQLRRADEALAWQKSPIAVNACGRPVAGQRLQLRPTRTLSATMGSESGRLLKAAAADAAAVARFTAKGPPDEKRDFEWAVNKIEPDTGPVTMPQTAAANERVRATETASNHLSSSAAAATSSPQRKMPTPSNAVNCTATHSSRPETIGSGDNQSSCLDSQIVASTAATNNCQLTPTVRQSNLDMGELVMRMAAEDDQDDEEDDRKQRERGACGPA